MDHERFEALKHLALGVHDDDGACFLRREVVPELLDEVEGLHPEWLGEVPVAVTLTRNQWLGILGKGPSNWQQVRAEINKQVEERND